MKVKMMNKKSLTKMSLIGISLFLLVFFTYYTTVYLKEVESGPKGYFAFTQVWLRNDSALEIYENENVTFTCGVYQPGAGSDRGSALVGYQNRTNSTDFVVWTNTPNTVDIIYTSGNPDSKALENINQAVNTTHPSHDINFTKAGTYYINCTEQDSASNNVFLTSQTLTVTVSTPPDDTKPTYSANSTSIVNGSVYDSSNNYGFQINWTDNVEFANSTFWTDLNVTGGKNFTSSDNGEDTYYINFTDVPAGTYYYIWYGNDTAGNDNATDNMSYTIEKAGANITMWINGTEGDKTLVYPSDANITCKINFTTSSQNTFTLLQNGTSKGSQSGQVIEHNTDLAARHYNFTCNYTGQNYTDFTREQSLILNKAATNTTLYLNGTRENKTYGRMHVANFTVTVNTSYDATVNLSSNYTGWVMQSDTDSTLENFTTLSSTGNWWNMTGHFDGDENHTSSSETWFFNVTLVYGTLEVNLSDPYPGTYDESSPKQVTQYTTFWMNATIKCVGATGAICDEVNGTARYNGTAGTTEPNHTINVTEGAIPLYVVEEPFEKGVESESSMGAMGEGSTETKLQPIAQGTPPQGPMTPSIIGQFNPSWVVEIVQNESDSDEDGLPDVYSNVTPINSTFIEIYVNDTREVEEEYKWKAVICNISGIEEIGKWEYNFETEVWTYTPCGAPQCAGSLMYGNLSDYSIGISVPWCNETGNMGFLLYGAGSGDKRYRLNFTNSNNRIIIYTGSSSEIINSSVSTSPFYPEQRIICRDGKSNIHVAWRGNDSGTNVIMYANSTDNGATWTNRPMIHHLSSAYGPPAISCHGDNITIVYEDATADRLRVNFSTDNGETWGGTTPFGNSVPTGGLATERRGDNIYIVYEAGAFDINFTKSSDGGATWSTPTVIFSGAPKQAPQCDAHKYGDPSIAVNGSGGADDQIFVVGHWIFEDWISDPEPCNVQQDTQYGLKFVNSTDSGDTWTSSPLTIKTKESDDNQRSPSITFNMSNSSKLHLAYFQSGLNPGIFYQNSTDGGASWSGQTRLVQQVLNTNTEYASVTVDNSGNPWVFWSQEIDDEGLSWNVVYRKYNGTDWLPAGCGDGIGCVYNITKDGDSGNEYVNTKYNASDDRIEFVWKNRTSTPYWILYSYISLGEEEADEAEISVTATPNVTTVTRGGYVNVTATITCSNKQCNATNATITLPSIFELASGEPSMRQLGDLAVGNHFANWTVKAIHNGSDVINVTVESVNSTGEINDTDSTDSITVTEPLNPKTCGYMSKDETCTIKWLINATGAANTAYKIDVNFTSNNTNIASNDTNNSIITIKGVVDENPPTFSNDATNTTLAGRPCNFTIDVTDGNTLDNTAGYKFSTNNSGVWENSSYVPFTGSVFLILIV